MAGQGLERRDMLRMLAMAAAISEWSGFERWTFAFAPAMADEAQRSAAAPKQPYEPRFLTADEYMLVQILAALIIPSDGSPGAADAGVAEFIDTMAAHDRALQPRLRRGLGWVQARARLLHGRRFDELVTAEHIAFLEPLAYAAQHRRGEEEGRRFFQLIREYTVMGFYTSRMGLEQLGYPGLRTYGESPGCPDPSDPLHRHRRPRMEPA